MALTQSQELEAGRNLAGIFYTAGITAVMNDDDFESAINSIDVAMETVINTVPAGWQTKTFKQALIDNLPTTFKNNSTTAQKAHALAVWALKEAGVI